MTIRELGDVDSTLAWEFSNRLAAQFSEGSTPPNLEDDIVKGKEAWWRYVDWRLFVPVLIFGGALHYYPTSFWLSDLVRGGLSEAIMIAAILGLTVDRIAKDKLLADVSTDIWHHLMAWNLPAEIKTFIKNALDTRLVCTRYELRYRFELREEDDRLNVYLEVIREIENFGPKPEEVAIVVHIFLDEEPEFISLVCETENGEDINWPEDPHVLSVQEERGALALRGDKKVKLASHGHKGSKITLTRRHRIVKRTTDTDVSAHGIPSTSTIISVEKPDWIDFAVDKQLDHVGPIWRINEVLWPGAFHRVRWFDRRGAIQQN